MTTLLVAPRELDGEEVAVTGEAHHHLFRVARLAVGESLRVVDGAGRARAGVVVGVERARAVVRLGEPLSPRDPVRRVTLLVAPPKPERAAWLVEKATELGVAAVRFLLTGRVPRPLTAGQVERLRRVAAAALAQCGGATLPEVSGPHRWDELPALLAGARAIALDLGGGAACWSGSEPLALLVGPEGGWTEAERASLARLGVTAGGLGERVLRVETAAVAALALALHEAP